MILEHEVIEQIAEEPNGRPIHWVCDLLRELGANDPWALLQGMWRAGTVALVDNAGEQLPSWRCEQLWRGGHEPLELRVKATDIGRRSAFL